MKILSNASESSLLARLKVLIIRATLARVSASMSISAYPPHNSVSRRLPRSPFMINSKTASQPVPRPSHRTVYRQLSRRPNVLACQPGCRPVPRPPLSSLFCSVSWPSPPIGCQAASQPVLRALHRPLSRSLSRLQPQPLLACRPASQKVTRSPYRPVCPQCLGFRTS